MANYALLVGINDYGSHSKLRTPVRDVEAIEKLLSEDEGGRSRWHTEVLAGARRSARVTEDRVSTAIGRTLHEATADKGHVLFYFAGHGDRSTLDGHRLFVQGPREDTSDIAVNLRGIVDLIHGANVKSATIILDCCFAGGAGDQPDFPLRKDRAILASSRDDQESNDGARVHSPFAEYAIEALTGVAASLTGEVTITGLYEHVRKRFARRDQRVQMRINLASEPVVLRAVEPKFQMADLFRIFRDSLDTVVYLDQDHEGEGRPFSEHPGYTPTQKQLDFDILKKLRNLGLIESEDDEDLYWLAVREPTGGKVWLSPLGKWYMRQKELRWI